MNILEYKPNFGTFTHGFETFTENEVVEVIKLDRDSYYGYNRIHKQWFPPSFSTITSYEPENNIDLAIFNPDFGENISRKGRDNFYFYDFQNCISFLEVNHPKFAIFQTEVDVIPLLNTALDYIRDGFNQVSKDRLIYLLQKIGYKAHLVVIDEADYGIPLHRTFAFYIATPKNFKLRIPKPLFTATGKGSYVKFRTVKDAIADLDETGEWVEYGSKPLNAYQRWLRTESDHVTWHHTPQTKQSVVDRISTVLPGSNNDTYIPHGMSKGYNRAEWDKICSSMDSQFYLASSKTGQSIHPIRDRPFTIREGCRLHGLPDSLSFDLKTSRKVLAKKIHNSVAPAIGQIFSIGLGVVN